MLFRRVNKNKEPQTINPGPGSFWNRLHQRNNHQISFSPVHHAIFTTIQGLLISTANPTFMPPSAPVVRSRPCRFLRVRPHGVRGMYRWTIFAPVDVGSSGPRRTIVKIRSSRWAQIIGNYLNMSCFVRFDVEYFNVIELREKC